MLCDVILTFESVDNIPNGAHSFYRFPVVLFTLYYAVEGGSNFCKFHYNESMAKFGLFFMCKSHYN